MVLHRNLIRYRTTSVLSDAYAFPKYHRPKISANLFKGNSIMRDRFVSITRSMQISLGRKCDNRVGSFGFGTAS